MYSHGLFEQPEFFVARREELSYIYVWGERGSKPLLVLGPAGIGKTSLVLKYADITRSHYDAQFRIRNGV